MTLEPISNTNIMVGYISETEGYVRGLLVPEANEYEKNIQILFSSLLMVMIE